MWSECIVLCYKTNPILHRGFDATTCCTDYTFSALADFQRAAMAGGAYNRLWNSVLPPGCLAAHAGDPGACELP